ncbi:hypothetical protein [Mucilaginibacter sp.]|uniref:hypothetical protein n=1 Tax=Mucilaginibacter sp. TaxID=1882438 RepID=UPI0028494BEE|nr:hypothetical protein [Mucilaginibacter sp.]MDR3693941.1 hypothetical protein [Mucilaginibacter sp.]
METLKQYLIPYLLSNIIFGLSIVAALKKPMVCRVFFATFFLWACYINSVTAIATPRVYLTYARLNALPFYSNFITGFFSQHITLFVLMIAAGQLSIACGLVLNKKLTKFACLGGIIFGMSIAPLGIGSAFPATISMAVAFYILSTRYKHNYIWKWKQYATPSNKIKTYGI